MYKTYVIPYCDNTVFVVCSLEVPFINLKVKDVCRHNINLDIKCVRTRTMYVLGTTCFQSKIPSYISDEELIFVSYINIIVNYKLY